MCVGSLKELKAKSLKESVKVRRLKAKTHQQGKLPCPVENG